MKSLVFEHLGKSTVAAKPGKRAIKFNKGGLHASLHVPQGKTIPASKHKAAMAGKAGPLAKKQELFKRNVLTGRK